MSRALLAVPLAIALLAWGSGVYHVEFDYDEVMQAHTIWMITQGLVPFRDFFECHPPFVWYLYAPAFALLPDGPELLFGLRILSVLGNAAWFAALVSAARAARPALRAEWLALAAILAASHPLVIYFGAQFRPDAWIWAAAFAALARAIRLRAGFRRAAELGAAGSLCALALPKLALLFPAYAALDLARRQVSRSEPQASEDHRVGEPLARDLAGYAVGIALGMAAAAAFLFAVGIDPLTAWDLSVVYHGYVAAHYGTGTDGPLWFQVATAHASLAVVFATLLAWAAWLRRERAAPTTLELAVLATCAGQLLLVPFPYVQYTAPMFVLPAIFAPYCGAWAEAIAARRPHLPRAVLASACAIAAGLAVRPLAGSWGLRDAADFAGYQRLVAELAPPDARIAVAPPFHPVVRRDAFYGLVQTWMPSGLTTEETLRRLALPYRERVGAAVYLRELEETRPAVVLFTDERVLYSPEQRQAIAAYLTRHVRDYRRVGTITPALWVRADLVVASQPRLP